MVGPKPRKMFAEAYPELVQFWSPKNIKGPDEVGFESVQEVWWEVPGFEPFRKTVRTVGRSGYAAPMQRPKHSIADEPGLADEFADDNRLPANFVGRSRKDHFNWVCRDCGTKWTAAPYTRWNGMHGCPKCTAEAKAPERAAKQALRDERKRIKDERKALGTLKFRLRKVHTKLKIEKKRRDNAAAAEKRRLQRLHETKSSLADVCPEVAAELVGADPSTISAKSGIKQRWRGYDCGHEWEAVTNDRVRKGSGCPVCAGRLIVPGINDLLTMFPDTAAEWSDRNDEPVNTVSPGSNTKFWWQCRVCGHEWQTQPNYRCFGGYGCPACFKTGRSQSEEDLFNYINDRVGHSEPQRHVTGLLAGQKEVDVFVPELNVAFEFNGLHWHREGFVGREYHRDKVVEARDRGIRLVHVWEDDWECRRRIVEQKIDTVLGVDERRTISAGECVAVEVSHDDAVEFLKRNHLHGAPREFGEVYGLAYGDELVAVLVADRVVGGREITRYAESVNVAGGFARLLAQVEQEVAGEGGGTVTAYSDNSYSDGAVFAAAGFANDGDVAPDYMFAAAHGKRRPKDMYPDEVPEGIFRVYDAGKVRWVKRVSATR